MTPLTPILTQKEFFLLVGSSDIETFAGLDRACEAYAAALAEIEKLRKAQVPEQWIPVSERLPEHGIRVLAHGTYDNHPTSSFQLTAEVLGGRWNESPWIPSDTGHLNDWPHVIITHWQPLPAPPTPQPEEKGTD